MQLILFYFKFEAIIKSYPSSAVAVRIIIDNLIIIIIISQMDTSNIQIQLKILSTQLIPSIQVHQLSQISTKI